MSVGNTVSHETQRHFVADASQTRRRSPGRFSRQGAVDAVAALDLVAVTAAGLLPAYLHGPLLAASGPDWQRVAQASLIAGILTVLCLKSADTFESSSVHDFPVEPARIAGNVAIAMAAIVGLILPASASAADWWLWLAVWFTTGAGAVIAIHATARRLLRHWTSAGRFDRRVAVFGAGPIALRIRDHIADNDLGVEFAGLWDDRMDEARIDSLGVPVVGRLADLVVSARQGRIDQVIIALPQAADGRIADIARRFDDTGTSIHIVTHIASDVVGKPKAHNVSTIGHVGLLDVRSQSRAVSGWRSLLATA